MGKVVAKQSTILFDGVSIADHCGSIDVKDEKEQVPTNNLGNGTNESVHGLRSGEVTLEIQQDYAEGSVFQIFKAAYLNETEHAFEYRLFAAARSSTNPATVGQVKVFSLGQGAKVGELVMFPVTLQCQGAGFTYPTA